MNSTLVRALFLVLGCVCYRLFFALHPEWLPNISPLTALALVGTIYLPRRWGWLLAPLVFVVTDLALLATNQRAVGWTFSWLSLAAVAFYVLVGFLGLALARHKSLGAIAAGSIVCSLVFYVMANTFAWGGEPAYAPTLAGWWQANTVGLPGWAPTWTFLRNGLLGDLFFCGVFVAILDRELLLHPTRQPSRTWA